MLSESASKGTDFLLSMIAECLDRAGISAISPGDFRLLAGTEAFFDGESIANAKEAQKVAMLALTANALEENIQAIRKAYGDVIAEHVAYLAKPFNTPWESRVSVLLKCVTDQQELVNWAAAALLHAEFLYYLHGSLPDHRRRVDTLREAIPKKGNAAISKLNRLWDTMAQANLDEPASSVVKEQDTGPPWLISISLDLGGSTAAKTALTKVAGGEVVRLKQLYAQFYRLFMDIEHRFYSDIFRKVDREPDPLDFSKLFLIKGVGDELWMVYPIRRNDLEGLSHAMSRILPATLQVAYHPVEFLATEKEEDPNFDPHQEENDLGRHEWVRSPVKVFIDLIDDAYEIAEPRGEFFHPRIIEYYDPDNNRKFFRKIDARHAEVSSRLNLGFAEIGLRQFKIARRSDYIGHGIDLFFRASKGAKPGLVTLGNSISSRLNMKEEDSIDASGLLFTKVAHCFRMHPESPSARRATRYWICETILRQSEMKGIGYDYKLTHIFNHFELLGVLKQWGLTRKFRQPGEKDPYLETRKLISVKGIETVCERERRR